LFHGCKPSLLNKEEEAYENLVVDDARYMIKVLKDILTACGHEVHEAVTGEEALIRCSDVRPNVVLMDILMPSIDGISATKKILEHDPLAKLVVITAVRKTVLEKECLEARY
jgi:two-component system, chemotaxis family, chemotaxis protein CheY